VSGFGNNPDYPEWGAAETPFLRIGNQYCWLPTENSRIISNKVA
jgi:hypothetical protein